MKAIYRSNPRKRTAVPGPDAFPSSPAVGKAWPSVLRLTIACASGSPPLASIWPADVKETTAVLATPSAGRPPAGGSLATGDARRSGLTYLQAHPSPTGRQIREPSTVPPSPAPRPSKTNLAPCGAEMKRVRPYRTGEAPSGPLAGADTNAITRFAIALASAEVGIGGGTARSCIEVPVPRQPSSPSSFQTQERLAEVYTARRGAALAKANPSLAQKLLGAPKLSAALTKGVQAPTDARRVTTRPRLMRARRISFAATETRPPASSDLRHFWNYGGDGPKRDHPRRSNTGRKQRV